MDNRSIYLSFADLQHPIVLTGCAELSGIIGQLLRGWEITPYEGLHDIEPIIRIEKTGSSYTRHSRWLDQPASFDDPVDAVCDFLVDLTKAYLDTATGMMCLHGAAAHFSDGLVLFPSTYRAGKSTLCVELARRGVRIFSDDVLPIENNRNFGVAPGILPRLRLPLHEDAGNGFLDFINSTSPLMRTSPAPFPNCISATLLTLCMSISNDLLLLPMLFNMSSVSSPSHIRAKPKRPL